MKIGSFNISFNTNFAQTSDELDFDTIKAFAIIIYDERIRILQEIGIDCYLKENKLKTNIASFFCETGIKSPKIKQVKILPKFSYNNQDIAISLTPLAKKYMDTLQDIDDRFDNLENCIVYILEHSVYNKYSTYNYNITGIIDQEKKSKLEGKNINLTINLEENEISTESPCTIFKNNETSYSLDCELKENIIVDLDSAISFINEEEILLISFDNGNSTLEINTPHNKYFSKNSKGLKSGEIFAIILPIAFVLIAIIGLVIYFKNKKNHGKNESSTISESIGSLKMK